MPEEGVWSPERAVDELVRHDHVTRPDLLAHRAARADADDLAGPEEAETPQVRPIGYLRRQQPMAPAMPGEEGHAAPLERADDDGIRWFAERRGRTHIEHVRDAREVVQPRPADNADLDLGRFGKPLPRALTGRYGPCGGGARTDRVGARPGGGHPTASARPTSYGGGRDVERRVEGGALEGGEADAP